MKRNKLGKFAQELKDPVLLKAQVERYDHDWLKKEAAKKKMSVASLVRHYIWHYRKFISN